MQSCHGLSCIFSLLYTATVFFVNKEKLNNGYTITSLKLYIPKLSCICWHTGVKPPSANHAEGGY